MNQSTQVRRTQSLEGGKDRHALDQTLHSEWQKWQLCGDGLFDYGLLHWLLLVMPVRKSSATLVAFFEKFSI